MTEEVTQGATITIKYGGSTVLGILDMLLRHAAEWSDLVQHYGDTYPAKLAATERWKHG